jgi:Tol biopolymer transport system component
MSTPSARWWLTRIALALSAACASSQSPPSSQQPSPSWGPPLRPSVLARDLLRLTSDPGQELWPAPSPDGKRLAFSVSKGQDDAVLALQDLGSPSPWRAVTPPGVWSGFPAWEPDGSALVYERNAGGKYELVASAPSAEASANVLVSGDASGYPRRPALSPDGKRLVYVTGVGSDTTLQLLSGGTTQALGPGNFPAWSPDGHRLAFSRVAGGRSQVFILDPDASTAPQQLTWGDFNSGQPAWSPDGALLVFSSDRRLNAYGQSGPNGASTTFHRSRGYRAPRGNVAVPSNLFLMHPDGSAVAQLTEGGFDSGMPSWGRDGFIYFSSNALGSFDVWRLRPVLAPEPPPAAPASSSPGL